MPAARGGRRGGAGRSHTRDRAEQPTLVMPKRSAGILLYKHAGTDPRVLLVHPGGPFWAKKDAGAWSIPKGEYGEGEDAFAVAVREFEEETGMRLARFQAEWSPVSRPESAPTLESGARSDAKPASTFAERAPMGEFRALGEVKQTGGKVVTAWAVEGEFDPATLKSNR